MNSNSDHTQPIIPGLNYLVIDPFAISGRCADKNNRASAALHLFCDPALDFLVLIGAASNRLPIIVFGRLVTFD